MESWSQNEARKWQNSKDNGSRPGGMFEANNNPIVINNADEEYWDAEEENWDVVNNHIGDVETESKEEKKEPASDNMFQDQEINNSEDMWDMGPRFQFGAFNKKSMQIHQVSNIVENKDVVFDVQESENFGNALDDNNNEDMWDMDPRFNKKSTQDHHVQEVAKNEDEILDVYESENFENALDDNNHEDMWDMGPRFNKKSTQDHHVQEVAKNEDEILDVYESENFENAWNDSNDEVTINVSQTNENDRNNASRKDVEPPREIYIPSEPSNDENDIFGTGIPLGINFEKLDLVKVQLSGDNLPTAVTTFEELNLDANLINNIKKSGYRKPTKIQQYCIPVVMAERDVMACAQTGSGKTAAFLIPILNKIISKPKNIVFEGYIEPQVVIVSPTRELALQIYHEARKFAYRSDIQIEIAYGGTSVSHQLSRIQKGCHILVATPGRLNAFVKRGVIKFSSIRFVVLDEADRMLDMGFSSDVESILKHPTMVPAEDRKTLMFSATFPQDIQELAAKFLQNYIFVTVGSVGAASTDVQQVVYQVEKVNKRNKLFEVLKESDNEGTLVFVETKLSADFIAAFLNQKNFRTTSIHGDRLQSAREEALRDFRSGKSQILVATSVAARGLDIKNVKHVINYDLPKDIDNYVHRIGRTGRIGNLGKATSFYDENRDSGIAVSLARILEQAGQTVPEFLLYGERETQNNDTVFDVRDTRQNYNQVTVYEERWDV